MNDQQILGTDAKSVMYPFGTVIVLVVFVTCIPHSTNKSLCSLVRVFDLNLSEEINDQFLGGLNSASKNPLKEPIIFYPVSFLYHYL